jgi:hypothetical protein
MLRERGKSLILMIYCAPLGRIPIPPSVDYTKETIGMAVSDLNAGKLAGVVTYVLNKSGPAPAAQNYAHSGNGRATLLASGTGMKVGDYAGLSAPITAAASSISFWRTAYYSKLPPGYFFLQLLAGDNILWEQDVATFESNAWKQEHVEAAAPSGATLHVRLAVKKNTGSIALVVGLDDLTGISVTDPGFEKPAAWTPAQTMPALMPLVQIFDPQRPIQMYEAVRALYGAVPNSTQIAPK